MSTVVLVDGYVGLGDVVETGVGAGREVAEIVVIGGRAVGGILSFGERSEIGCISWGLRWIFLLREFKN